MTEGRRASGQREGGKKEISAFKWARRTGGDKTGHREGPKWVGPVRYQVWFGSAMEPQRFREGGEPALRRGVDVIRESACRPPESNEMRGVATGRHVGMPMGQRTERPGDFHAHPCAGGSAAKKRHDADRQAAVGLMDIEQRREEQEVDLKASFEQPLPVQRLHLLNSKEATPPR